MCGRTACTLAPDELCKACKSKNFDVSWRDHPGDKHNYSPNYNVAPTMHTPIIFKGEQLQTLSKIEPETEYIMQPMMWNLIPHFYKGDDAKSTGYKTNNCRVESVESKPMFLHLIKKGQRCVVLCDGFYEWHTLSNEKTKTPYLIYATQPENIKIWDRSSWENSTSDFKSETTEQPKSEDKSDQKPVVKGDHVESPSKCQEKVSSVSDDKVSMSNDDSKVSPDESDSKADIKKESDETSWHGPVPLKMAGLFSKWTSTEGEEVWSYTVLTRESGDTFSWLHHRVPLILNTEQQMKDWLDGTELSDILEQCVKPSITWHEVSSEVNNSRNNSPNCVKPADHKKAAKASSASSRLMSSWLSGGSKRKSTSQDDDNKKPKTS